MTPIEFLAAVPIVAFISFIWGALQTEEVNATAYKEVKPHLWVETKTKVKKPVYPNISDPVLPDKPMK